MSDKIALFVPVYNEAETLPDVLSRIPQNIRGIPVDIVVADDCSIDDSVAIARKFTSHVVSSKENLGVGAITRKGLCYISDRREYGKVIKLDGDGQHDVNKIILVEAALDKHRVVVCSRFHPESDQTNTPVDRILLNLVFAGILRRITGVLRMLGAGSWVSALRMCRQLRPTLSLSGMGFQWNFFCGYGTEIRTIPSAKYRIQLSMEGTFRKR